MGEEESSGSGQEKKEAFPDDFYKYDKSNMGKFFDSFSNDIRKAYAQDFRGMLGSIKKSPGMRVIHCGMGGSAIAVDLINTYLHGEFLVESVRDYSIPGSLSSSDLVIFSSYSGNTEEVLSCYRQARREGCQVIVVSSGGKIEDAVGTGRVPYVKLPKGFPPRAALPFMFFSLLKLFENLGFVTPKKEEVDGLLDYLSKNSLDEIGMALSGKFFGRIPLFYAPKSFFPVAYRWKTQVNENAKAVAFAGEIPEMNHNEISGFVNKNAMYHAVLLSTDSDNSRVRKRVLATKNALQKAGVDLTELNFKGSNMNKVISAVLLGDLASYYLALRYRVDPLPVNIIESLKREMGPFI